MSRQKQKIYNLNMHPLPRPQVPPQRDKLEFVGLKKMLSLRTQTEACHCEPVRTLANPPDFQDTIIEQLPLFFCVYGRTGPVLADRKIRGIATPACALVRNDMFYFSAINTNLSYRTDTCSAPFRAAISADGIAKRTETHWQRALPAKHQFVLQSGDGSVLRRRAWA